MLTRRHFIRTTTALFSASISSPLLANSWPIESRKGAWDVAGPPLGYGQLTTNPWGLHPRFLPQRVVAKDGLVPGDIHVDAVARYLYHIEDGGTAMRYGVAIGRGDLYEPGVYTIRRKVEWPHWTPTRSMIEREPELYAQYEDGMEPGPQNALGSRALYLYFNNQDTYLDPWDAISTVRSEARQVQMRQDGHGPYQRPLSECRDRIRQSVPLFRREQRGRMQS